MKTSLLLLALSASQVLLAAPFQNFGFDVSPVVPDQLPGWTPGPNQQSAVGYNQTQRFSGRSSLLDVNYVNTTQPANPARVPVVGTFSLGIWPESGNRFDEVPFTLSQAGDIPADAQSLRFLYHGDNLQVSVGGSYTAVHFVEDVASGNPDVPLFHYYAVDVSAFAGQAAELKFEFRSFGNYPGQPGGPEPFWPDAKMHVLDDLSFSSLPAVPEPETWALLGVGLATLLWWQRRR